MTIEKKVQIIMECVDDQGAPPLPKPEWKDLLESVITECEMRLEAVKEELAEEAEPASDENPHPYHSGRTKWPP